MKRIARPAFAFLRGVIFFLATSLLPGLAGESAPFDPKLLDTFRARALGPANMGGRVVDVAVVQSKPATLYVATASGGLWKTGNNGITWDAVFDREETIALGAVTVAPSNPNVIWVGTGESNARNSVSWGDGVYRSGDGGKSWRNMGLRDSAHVGRIVIHPKNPDIVFVAALGRLWGPNKERGLFKTRDGGQTWQQALFIDEDTGCIDLVMDPSDPDILYVAAYQCRRDAFSGGNPAVQTGPGSGLYKTYDGGNSWARMTKGLPDRPLGRCGLAVYAKDPRIVVAVVQTDKTISTVSGQPAKRGDKIDTGGIFRSEDGGDSWVKLNDLCPRPFYYGQVRIDPADDKHLYVLGIAMHVSRDGGKTFKDNGAPKVHSDHHALWIDPRDSAHLVLGCDGGINFSYDGGAAWEHLNNLPISQFYAVAADMRKPYRVYGGLQDNGTWCGPSATRNAEGITNADWNLVLGADGFQCQIDPTDPDTVYAEFQFGMLRRVNMRTGERKEIRPQSPKKEPAYRFNWNAPMLLSGHNPKTLYYGGNHLFRSLDRGDHWQTISPDLTRGKPGSSPDSGHTLTAIAESPLKEGLLYAGTDDGRVHVTRNGGTDWAEVTEKVPNLAGEGCISRLECSHFAEGTVYLAIDRHRLDDRAPYIFKSTDYGDTWEPRANGLPAGGPVWVIREDPRNPDLLFAGTEFGLFVSGNGGGRWQPLRAGMPTVAVHDLFIHSRDRELVIGTHGRGIYILDIAVLEELSPAVLAQEAHLFEVKPAVRFNTRSLRPAPGAKVFAAPNPPYGAQIAFYLKDAPTEPAKLTISDAQGATVKEWQGTKEAGLHRMSWDLRQQVKVPMKSPGPPVPAGEYAAELQVGGKVWGMKFRVEVEE